MTLRSAISLGLTGDTPDISEFTDIDLYDVVRYDTKPGDIDNGQFAKFLGVAHKVGAGMCYWVLPESGIPQTRPSV
jgi:hypothetical protein